MTAFENLSTNQKIRATIHRDTKLICTETCHSLGLEITKPATELIAELVYKKLNVYGKDLEAFAKHAKRQTINSDDVKLLVRRNPSLLARITELSGNTVQKEKRRKTATLPVAKQPDTPRAKPKELEKSPEKEKEKEKEGEERVADVDMIDLTFD